MAEIVDQLLKTLDSLDESPQFCVSGSVTPVLPGLEVKGVGPVGVPVTPGTARQLIEQASQAPYGRGEETIVDTDVRRVWQIEPAQLSLHNPQWETLVEGIVDAVRKEFGIKGKVKAELYKLLIYEKGSFFAPHRDTEKVEGMFATLVVCLPSRHEGGTLIVSHDRQTKEIDFGGAHGEFQVQYVAFYADCRHEIKPVTQGYRVCLVYNLALAQKKRQPEAPRFREEIGPVAKLLEQLFADRERQKVALLLKHEYTEAGLGLDRLKGSDRSCVAVLQEAAEQLKYHCYLALMHYRQRGSPDESTVCYDRWGGTVESSVEMGDVYEESLTLDHWIDADGQSVKLGKMALGQEEILSDTPFEDFPFQMDVHEATGNEGATVERWYRQAVVVIWPPDRYFAILARQGQGAAIPALEKLIAGSDDPSSDEDCRTLARETIKNWKVPSYYERKESPEPVRLLEQLERIGDATLVSQFLHDVLPRDYRGTEGEVLGRLGDRLGWKAFAGGLTRFVSLQEPARREADLGATAAIVEGFCGGPGKKTAQRKAACRAVAAELERIVRKWDAHKEYVYRYGSDKGREGVVERLVRALAAADEGELLGQFLAHALADTEHYGLHKALIPAVKAMYGWTTKEAAVIEARQDLLRHCITELERLTEKPVEEPKDWAQDVTLRCTCRDCQVLQQFLRDPHERVLRFPAGKPRRKHLHGQLGSPGCDVTHVTERGGSPETLVCTKTRASYERKKAEHATNVQLLAELRGLEQPKGKKGGRKGPPRRK